MYAGATPDFVDIDPQTWCMSVEKLSKKLEKHRLACKPLPKVVIPVHLSGQSCDMKAISKLGAKYGFKIIEDSCHALGGKYKNKKIGSCFYSEISTFSFHPVKLITTGEGGLILTNNNSCLEQPQAFGLKT